MKEIRKTRPVTKRTSSALEKRIATHIGHGLRARTVSCSRSKETVRRLRVLVPEYFADRSDHTQNKIKEFFEIHMEFPNHSKLRSQEERNLAHLLRKLCKDGSDTFSQTFKNWAIKNGYGIDRGEVAKQELKNFYDRCGRLPSSVDKAESSDYWALLRYCSPSSRQFDNSFKE